MSSGSEERSSEGNKEQQRSSSRSRSREKRHDRDHHYRERDRKTKIKVPELTVPLYSLKHFGNLQNDRVSNETLQKAYDRYRKDWEQRQNEEFLKEYKNDAWFSQKYDPEVLDLLEKDRKDNCRKLHQSFIAKLNSGEYDHVDLTARDPNELGIVEKFEEDEEQHSGLSYVLSQAYDVHVSPQTEIHGEPYFGFDQNLNTLFIKTVPRSISRYDIRSVVEKLEGYKTLTMSDPVKKNNLSRYCWIDFQDEESCNKAVLSLSGLMVKNETLVVTKSSTKMKRIKVLKNYPSSRRETDTNTMTRLIQTFDKEVGIDTNPLLERQTADSKTRMDLLLLYLRKVHAFDYFTSCKYENQRILALKVSSAFLRVEAEYEELENVQTVFKKIQEKAEERVQKGSEVRDYMGILREEMQAFIRETNEVGKEDQKEVWKCLYCDKKFKTCEFLSKHMIAKHEDIKFKKIQAVMERLYLQDPLKITFASLADRDTRHKRPFNPHYRRERRREYRDFDEPEPQKSVRPSGTGGRQMINFLDI